MPPWLQRYQTWEGTAEALATAALAVMAERAIADGDGTRPNERLVRHYVQVGVLDRPERRGKEALFGLRQLVQFLAARALLADGWPLAKIAEVTGSAPLAELVALLPAEPARTPAQALVERLRRGTSGAAPRAAVRPPAPSEAGSARATVLYRTVTQARATATSAPPPDAGETVRADGPYVRLALTPWCQVFVHPDSLTAGTADLPERLGQALTRALTDLRAAPSADPEPPPPPVRTGDPT